MSGDFRELLKNLFIGFIGIVLLGEAAFLVFYQYKFHELNKRLNREKQILTVLVQDIARIRDQACSYIYSHANLLDSRKNLLVDRGDAEIRKVVEDALRAFGFTISKIVFTRSGTIKHLPLPLELRLSLKGPQCRVFEFLSALREKKVFDLKQIVFAPQDDSIDMVLVFYTMSMEVERALAQIEESAVKLCRSSISIRPRSRRARTRLIPDFKWCLDETKLGLDFRSWPSLPLPLISEQEMEQCRERVLQPLTKKKKEPRRGTREFHKEPGLKVAGVIRGPEKNIAIINGQSYEEGEEVQGCKILKIEPDSVHVQCSKGRFYLPIGDH